MSAFFCADYEQAKGLRLIEEAKARRLAEAERKRQRDGWLAKLAANFPRAGKRPMATPTRATPMPMTQCAAN